MSDPAAEPPEARRLLAPAPRAPVAPLERAPTFTISVAAYQAARTIGGALHSAVAQVYPAHEIIVVDDGSTDALDDALAPFAGQITLIRKRNGGAASAQAAALAAATGDYLAILDADDAYHPRRLEALAELACARPDLDLITTDARFVVTGDAVGSFAAHNPFALEDQRTAILERCFVGGWPAVRVARLRAIGGFDESLRMGYDWDAWLRLILSGSLAGLVNEPYYDYHLHDRSLTANRVEALWWRVRLLEKAARQAALEPGERDALHAALRTQRSRAVFAEASAALLRGGGRRTLARRLVARGIGGRARLAAFTTVCFPPIARMLVPADIPHAERFAPRVEGGA